VAIFSADAVEADDCLECPYNLPGFQYFSPCDDCEESEAYCFLECEYNDKWQVNSPCSDCDRSNCDECQYQEKKLQLEARDEPAPSASR